MKKYFIYLIFFYTVIFTGCRKDDLSDVDFRQEMRDFVQEISQYAKAKDADFVIIPQNGVQIISSSKESLIADLNYINAIDGVGQESLFYGYSDDDEITPQEETDIILSHLDLAMQNKSIAVLVTDYCYTQSKVDDSYQKNHYNGYASFAADDRELRSIPIYPVLPNNVNTDTIQNLTDARNFLYIINTENYPTKEDFLNALENTDYDIILIDLFFSDTDQFKANDIAGLKTKNNGAQRMVICYMSIGEAEDYRFYWQESWSDDEPEWLEEENPQWKGNFDVRYWYDEWKNIIFGNDNSYLDKIIAVGFDGVYLDIIDGFEYFEEKYE